MTDELNITEFVSIDEEVIIGIINLDKYGTEELSYFFEHDVLYPAEEITKCRFIIFDLKKINTISSIGIGRLFTLYNEFSKHDTELIVILNEYTYRDLIVFYGKIINQIFSVFTSTLDAFIYIEAKKSRPVSCLDTLKYFGKYFRQ